MANDINQLISQLNRLSRSDKIIGQQVVTADTEMLKRIHDRGIAADGRKIGRYSTKPTLIGAKSFTTKGNAQRALGSKSKRKELEWRTVKGNKLAILPGGYKQIRQIEGVRVDKVVLENRGDLRRDWAVKKIKAGIWEASFKNKHFNDVAEGNQDRFRGRQNSIWALTKREEAKLSKNIDIEISKILK